MLHAFFDESGIHAWSPVTQIAGFIGTTREWRNVKKQWREAMSGEVFHYTEFSLEKNLLARLAGILASADLGLITSAFSGDWNKAIATKPDWIRCFPSCYHLCFEACVESMQRQAGLQVKDTVTVTFSQQHQFAKRAEEVWRTLRGNGYWQNIVSFSYGDPRVLIELQAADMLAHEFFQCMKNGDPNEWNNWPLVSRLREKFGEPMVGGYHTADTFIAMMEKSEKNGRQFLKTVPTK